MPASEICESTIPATVTHGVNLAHGVRARPAVRIMAENLRQRQIIAKMGAQQSD